MGSNFWTYDGHARPGLKDVPIFSAGRSCLALANIATATQANRTLVALLTKTILELSSQVAHLTVKLATEQIKNSRLKNRDIVQPRPSTAIEPPSIRPCQIQTQAKTEMCTPRADKNSTLTGTAPPMDTRWRKHTLLRLGVHISVLA